MTSSRKTMAKEADPSNEVPSREDYCDLLIRCYIGEGRNLLQLCVQRAFLALMGLVHCSTICSLDAWCRECER